MTDALPACETLLLERRGRHLHVTLNRPETRNALSAGMVDELGAVIDAVAGDRGLQSLVLRGAGGTFCAGGDISEFRSVYQAGARPEDGPDPIAVSNRRYGRLMARLNGLPQTVVAVIEGAAFGGGLGLLCGSDVAICRADARLALSETGLGLLPAQIAPFVVQRIGLTQTRRLALTGARIDGEEAAQLGLVHYACADAEALEARLAAVLHDIGRCGPAANAATKRILLDSLTLPLDVVLDQAAAAFAEAMRGAEAREGVAAFMERRAPYWRED